MTDNQASIILLGIYFLATFILLLYKVIIMHKANKLNHKLMLDQEQRMKRILTPMGWSMYATRKENPNEIFNGTE